MAPKNGVFFGRVSAGVWRFGNGVFHGASPCTLKPAVLNSAAGFWFSGLGIAA